MPQPFWKLSNTKYWLNITPFPALKKIYNLFASDRSLATLTVEFLRSLLRLLPIYKLVNKKLRIFENFRKKSGNVRVAFVQPLNNPWKSSDSIRKSSENRRKRRCMFKQ